MSRKKGCIPKGDCFDTAALLVRGNPDWQIVHGLVMPPDDMDPSKGSAIPGKRHWHAWAERIDSIEHPDWPHPIVMTYAVDKSNCNDMELPVEVYYHYGRIDPKQVRRYCWAEAVELMLHYKHYGPWDDEHPPMERFADDE